jgi:hypothetical protein
MTMFRDDILNTNIHSQSTSSSSISIPQSSKDSSFPVLSHHFDQSFSSSWNQQQNCILTLHYHTPSLDSCQWQQQSTGTTSMSFIEFETTQWTIQETIIICNNRRRRKGTVEFDSHDSLYTQNPG